MTLALLYLLHRFPWPQLVLFFPKSSQEIDMRLRGARNGEPLTMKSVPTPSARSILQFCCVVSGMLAIPIGLNQLGGLAKWLRLSDRVKQPPVMRASGGIQDAESGHAKLRADRPEWVLVGNSQLNSRVDPDYLEKLCGHPLYKLSFSATKSAMWYLMVRTIVVPSGVKPKVVTVFFRDRDLMRPTMRAGDNHEMIERLNGRDLPEWEQVMGHYDDLRTTPWSRLTDGVAEGLGGILPGAKWREWGRGKVQKIAFNVSAFGDSRDYPERREERNQVLSLDHARSQQAGPTEEELEAEAEKLDALEKHFDVVFDPSSDKSFLPHLVALAKKEGFVLHLHRIKTNPDTPPLMDEYVRTLPQFIADMRTWAISQGCLFTDESEIAEITGSYFVDMVHVKTDPEHQQPFMGFFWRQVQPLIDSVLSRNAKPAPPAP